MNSKTFPKSQMALLRADGTLEPLHLRPPMFAPGFVVLARERCLFERLDTAKGLSSRMAMAAARIHAQTAAPYLRSGSLITRQGPSFGIWWWDSQWVAERLSAAGLDLGTRILPEPMARAAGDGWRIAKASTGYEAQLWRGGFLVADLWRRRAFDNAAWQDFVRVQLDQTGADEAVLIAQDPPYTLQSPYRRMQLSEWTPDRVGQAAAVAAGIALLSTAAYFSGQALGLDRATERVTLETAALKASATAGQASAAGASGLLSLKQAVEYPDPIVLLENAQRTIEPFGHKLVAFTADRDRVRIVLPQDAIDDVGLIAAQLEASPYFSDVRPIPPGRDKQRLTIDMTPAGAKPKIKAEGKASGATTSLDSL
jgi:hypothetical protein